MKKTRQANFELLRIAAMVMVIMLHYLVKGAVAEDFVGNSTPAVYFAWLLEAFCLVSVNCYVLISGYFLVESDWKPGRVASLLCQVLFYSLLIPVFLIILGAVSANDISLYEWVAYAFPINTEHYWFATAYLMMYLFAPLLAEGIRRMDQKQLQIVTGLLLFFASIVKSVVPIAFATDRYGYDFGWFLCLFVLAGYIRRFGIPWLEKRSHAVFLYVLMSLATWAVTMICCVLSAQSTVFGTYGDRTYNYNHVFCLMGAVSLFYVFKDSEIKSPWAAEFICKLAPYTFGIYLLHEHVLVRYRWLEWTQVDSVAGKWSFIPHMTGCVALIYILGTVVDFLRARLFMAVVKGVRNRT